MKRRIRRARNEPPVVQERWRPGLFHLLGAALLLTMVAGFLRTNDGARLGLPGAFVWVMALFIAFGLGLAHRAPFVLPPEADDESGQGWREGLRMLAYYFGVIMLPPSLRRRYHRRREDVPAQLSPSFSEFQAGFVPSHLALALAKGAGFARAAGPGYVRLQRGERISHIVDLRRQVRREEIEAFTRDGIRLETSIAITFRVREPSEDAPPDVPFPYDPDAIFCLTYSDGVSAGAYVRWSERVCAQAASLLITEIARYRLDQFYRLGAPEASDAVWLSSVVNEVGTQLSGQLHDFFNCSSPQDGPIQILNVAVSHLQPPQDVLDQRIRNWQSAWERRKMLDKAESTAFEIRELQRVRADTLHKLILDVTYNVAQMCNGDREAISKVLMVRMADMLDRLMGDHRVKLETPKAVFDALSEVSQLLKPPPPDDAPPGGGPSGDYRS